MRRALVTGCCGFIGSNLTHKLVKLGWDVEGIDDMSNGHMEFLDGLNVRTVHIEMLHLYDNMNHKESDGDKDVLLIQGDFAHDEMLSRIKSRHYDVIFHLAANPRVGYSVSHPVETTETNILKTVGLFHASINNVDRVVFSSSCAVYGNTESLPTTENTMTSPASPYALQKLTGEQYARMFNDLYGLNVVSLRYFNVYGPRQYGGSPYASAISSWCSNVSEGSSLRSDGDGDQTRDMVFVDDVVNANILASTRPASAVCGNVFNIATGESFSNNAIMSIFLEKFGELKINHAPERKGDVKHTLADITSAKNRLWYTPSTSLREGLEKTWNWWGFK